MALGFWCDEAVTRWVKTEVWPWSWMWPWLRLCNFVGGHDHGHVYDHPSLAGRGSGFALGYSLPPGAPRRRCACRGIAAGTGRCLSCPVGFAVGAHEEAALRAATGDHVAATRDDGARKRHAKIVGNGGGKLLTQVRHGSAFGGSGSAQVVRAEHTCDMDRRPKSGRGCISRVWSWSTLVRFGRNPDAAAFRESVEIRTRLHFASLVLVNLGEVWSKSGRGCISRVWSWSTLVRFGR